MKRAVRLVGVSSCVEGALTRALSDTCDLLATANAWRSAPREPEDLAESGPVLVGLFTTEQAYRERMAEVRALRTDWLCMCPIVVLVGSDARGANWRDEAERIGVRLVPWPPAPDQLVEAVQNASPPSTEARQRIAESSLALLRDDLVSERRAERRLPPLEIGELAAAMSETVGCIDADAQFARLDEARELYAHLVSSMAEPSVDVLDLDSVIALTRDAERAGREARCGNRALTQVHRLSNILRYASEPSAAGAANVSRAAWLIHALPQLSDVRLPAECLSACERLRARLPRPLDGPRVPVHERSGVLAEVVHLLSEAEEDVLQLLRPFPMHSSGERLGEAGTAMRVLVVEDDPRWAEAIRLLLEAMGHACDVVSTRQDADRWLAQNTAPALVLVDMGLPDDQAAREAGSINLEAGLEIIREHGGAGSPNRFVVLTAHEGYPELVRAAIGQGIAPSAYIQKRRGTWEGELRMQVLLALCPRPQHRPRLDVYASTARLVRLDGIEVALHHAPYVVIEYLAERSRRWCPLGDIREDLSTATHRAIAPPISRERVLRCQRGLEEWPSSFELLTPERIHDHVYSARSSLKAAFAAAGRAAEYVDPIAWDAEQQAYRVTADAYVHASLLGVASKPACRSVLVVEDDPHWASAVGAELSARGFGTRNAFTLESAWSEIQREPPEMVSLDVQLPVDDAGLRSGLADEANGALLMNRLSRYFPEIRVAVLTSLEWHDTVMLNLLRDGVAVHDYISKQWPGAVPRLAASVWRMSLEIERDATIVEDASGVVPHRIAQDPVDARAFLVDGIRIALPEKAARLVRCLYDSPNAPLDRWLLADAVWPDPDDLPDDYEGALATLVSRSARAIAEATGGAVDGRKLLRSADGVYWLHGVVVQ